MRIALCVVVAALFCSPVYADESTDEAAVKAAFDGAKIAREERIAKLTKLGKKMSDEQKAELRKLRAATTVKLGDAGKTIGSVGRLTNAILLETRGDVVSVKILSNGPLQARGNRIVVGPAIETFATLRGYDSSKDTPLEYIKQRPAVILEKFEGSDAVYRVIDITPYEAKFGSVK